MQDSPKTIGAALLKVVDAAINVVKAEINGVVRLVSAQIKQKGIAVVLLLVAVLPLTAAAFFFILSIYQALLLYVSPWLASLIMGVLALLKAAGLIWIAYNKLSGGDKK